MNYIKQAVEFVRGQMYLFVVIEIIHFLDFSEKGVPESAVHDGSDLQEKVEFFDEVLAEGEVGAGHVVFDDVVESAVGGIREQGFLLQFADVQVELGADQVAFRFASVPLFPVHFPICNFY